MVRNGIANSAVHPTSETAARTCHAPSQFKLKPPPLPREKPPKPPPPEPPRPPPSLITCPSYSCPAGLVPNTKPFCWSLKVSSTIWTLSLSWSDESRRLSVRMIASGSASKQTMPKYTVSFVKTTRTSVRSVAGWPSSGVD